jgi:hypothetical protein
MYCRHDWLAAIDKVVDEVARLFPHTLQCMVVVDHFLDQRKIATRRETLSFAPDNDARDAGVAIYVSPYQRKVTMHVGVGGVEPLAGTDNDFEDPLLG